MKSAHNLFFALIGSMLCMQSSFAQHPHFRNLSTEEGLEQSIIYKAVEDSLGYTWLATSRGILQFNGRSFKGYGAKDGLTENTFYLISRVPETNTLLCISNSYKLFIYEKGRFRRISSRNDLCWITFDGQNKPYILTRQGDLLTLENGNLVPYYTAVKIWGDIYYQVFWINGKNFILNNDREVFYLPDNKNRTSVMKYAYSRTEQYIARIHKLNNGRIFLTNFSGFYELDTASKKVKYLLPLNHNIVYCTVLNEKTNDILVGCNDGLWIFRNGNIDASHRQQMLPGIYMHDIIKTSEGMFVFSTYSDGIFLSMMNAKHIDEKEGLQNPNIRYLHAQDTDLYLISDRTEMFILKDDKLHSFDPGNKIVRPNIPNFAISDSKGMIIGFTKDRSRVMRVYNRKVSSFRKPAGHSLGLSHIDGDQIFFMGSLNEEKNVRINIRYHKAAFGFVENNAINAATSFLMLIDTKKNRYYYGKDQGYIRQDLDGPPDSLRSFDLGSDVEFMLKMNDELMVAGTYNNGLALITDTSRIVLRPENGLSGIRCIKSLKVNNCLWVMTEKGLSKITFSKQGKVNDITNFHSNNVLKGEALNDFCIFKGEVHVAGKRGVSIFDQHLSFEHIAPHVNIISFNINNTDTALMDTYRLPYDENNITVSYEYPSLLNAGKTLYRYILIKGNDTLTDRTTSDEKLQLYSLASGEYVLLLWAMNVNGEWSAEQRILRFDIAPVFWKTWWFITLVSLLTGAVIITIVIYRIRVSQRESLLRNKLTESELRALRLHMNPHFIFNTLNSLQRFVLKGNPLKANEYIANFSLLIRWIMEYSDREQLSLQEEIDFLNLYIELEKLRFEDRFECSIKTDPELRTHELFIPSLTIQPFVENAVKYGLSGRTKGCLTINFTIKEQFLFVEVEDNGVGREQVKAEQDLSGKEKVSTGILYTEERLKLLIGNNEARPVKIIDLYKDDHAAGTRVELLIPILT